MNSNKCMNCYSRTTGGSERRDYQQADARGREVSSRSMQDSRGMYICFLLPSIHRESCDNSYSKSSPSANRPVLLLLFNLAMANL